MIISKGLFTKSCLVFIVIIGLSLGLGQCLIYASDITPTFKTYDQGMADVVWTITDEEDESISYGSFYVTLPNKFIYISKEENPGISKITGYKGLLGLHLYNGQVNYGYNFISLFGVYESLFGLLLESLEQPGIELGEGTMVGRQVQIFQDIESYNSYWFDQETNIPLKIVDQADQRRLSIKQYKVEPYNNGELLLLNLAVYGSTWEGLIVLENLNGFWLPQKLVITEDTVTVTIDYSNWEILDEAFQIPDLEQLDTYLELAYAAYEEKNLEEIIANFKQVLRIDPFNEQAYAYLSYAYGELENYLGAVESYQQWLMLDPLNATALNNLAYTYMLAGNFIEQAIAMAYQAYQLEQSYYTLDTIGYGYYLLKDYEKALHYLEHSIQGLSGTSLIDVLEHLVLVYQDLEDWENVRQYQQQIKELKMETEHGRTLF